jgi:DNA-binding protein HU-beta
MNKQELITAMADKSGMTKKDTDKAVNAFVNVVKDALIDGEKVQLMGFGTFEVRERAARKGRNPRNPQEEIDIPASKLPAFKPGKTFKDEVNK